METNLMSNELKQLLGIHEPSLNKCLIAVAFDGRAFLIKAENNFEEAFEGSDLEDNLTNTKQLPKEAGIYKCIIRYHSFMCVLLLFLLTLLVEKLYHL